MDNINLFSIVKYMDESEIVKKVMGFVEKHVDGEVHVHGGAPDELPFEGKHISSLGRFRDLLLALSQDDADGRIIAQMGAGPDTGFRYLQLNPAVHFQPIVAQARAVILMGGTMQPFEHFSSQLCVNATTFACGHVIPPDHVRL